MDLIRDTAPQKRKKRALWIVGGVALVALFVLLPRLLPTAVPSVESAILYTDTVVAGDLERQVGGAGTLVPEQMRQITAVTAGRIEQILMLPGSEVESGAVIMRMSNPDVDMQLLQAEQQLSQAAASLAQLRASLQTQELTQRATVVSMRTQLLDAQRVYATNQRLFDENPDLVARADLDRSKEVVEDLEQRYQFEQDRLEVTLRTAQEQLDAQEEQIRRLGDLVQFNRDRQLSMAVSVPVGGVLAPLTIPLQEGQWVQSGQELSRVVVPGNLKAEIRIPQTQAQEVAVGQTTFVDTRSDTIIGRVTRIDPAVRNGTVTIDIALPDDLPPSARPDLSVDGKVVIERLDDVVYMGRPSFGQANSRVSLFRVVEDGRYAERVIVELGASSVTEIEVRSGLEPGDIVILSDMSEFDGFDRVRIRR